MSTIAPTTLNLALPKPNLSLPQKDTTACMQYDKSIKIME